MKSTLTLSNFPQILVGGTPGPVRNKKILATVRNNEKNENILRRVKKFVGWQELMQDYQWLVYFFRFFSAAEKITFAQVTSFYNRGKLFDRNLSMNIFSHQSFTCEGLSEMERGFVSTSFLESSSSRVALSRSPAVELD